jgi:hypothetical protein
MTWTGRSLDETARQPTFRTQPAFHTGHPAVVGRVVVIVAQEV